MNLIPILKKKKLKKLDEIAETVKGRNAAYSYTVIHHDAKLSSGINQIEKWVVQVKKQINKGLNHQYYSVMTKTFSNFNTIHFT
jgi:hypothetical protein